MVNCNPCLNNNLDTSPNLNVSALVKLYLSLVVIRLASTESRIKSKVGITFQKYQGKDQAYG